MTTNPIPGGAFLITEPTPACCFFPEDFTEEQRQIAETTASFLHREVLPQVQAIEARDFTVIKHLLRQAANLGLTAIDVPEEYGGLELDKSTSAIVADSIAGNGSFGVAFSAHTGIGTMPLVWYGTPAQKAKYLPGIADGSLLSAYALSESSSGSDAVNARSRAVLSSDGATYTLNGEKLWISNGGFADLFTVFAKCMVREGKDAGKEKLTAFLVERGTPGFSNGAEEHKMGIRGSSTTPLLLSNCVIPAGNLLGVEGGGASIAFNILNVGRYKLGNAAVGGARHAFNHALRYSLQRQAFGKSICEFGLIQQKIATMATGLFIGEAMAYRTVGSIDAALAEINRDDTAAIQKVIEGYAAECSMVKVWCSEMLDLVVDESLQIFGGFGYTEDYPAERAYRDSRINRIFEGTNEINRLIITGWTIKQAQSGRLPLLPAIQAVMDEVMSGPAAKQERDGPLAHERDLLAAAKKTTLFVAGAATQRFGGKLAEEQEVMGALADMLTAVYTMESGILRAEKMDAAQTESRTAIAMAQLHAAHAIEIVGGAARTSLAALAAGDESRMHFAILRRLLKHEPTDTIALSRRIAGQQIEAGKYSL